MSLGEQGEGKMGNDTPVGGAWESEMPHPGVMEAFREAWEREPGLRVEEHCERVGLEDEGARAALADYLFVLKGLQGLGDSGDETRIREPGSMQAWEMPEWIDGYRVLRRLGEGGMGAVYLAEQQVPVKRQVALKLIKPGMDSREVLRRFEAERQALALMEHSHIARVFDAGSDEKARPFFVMEYVAGKPLDAYCEEKKLGLRDRIRLFNQVCAGVQHAHQKGVLHRDLKPSNVLVAEQDGQPMAKIIDFGLARAVDQEEGQSLMTLEGQVLGTPEFMAPEQACRTEAGIDSRADIYSLGVMLYLLLTDTLPVPSDVLRKSGMVEMRRKICEEDVESPSTRVSRETRKSKSKSKSKSTAQSQGAASRQGLAEHHEAPRLALSWQGKLRGDLDWITMKALEKDRERRYESAAALAEDLWRYLDHEPVLAGPPSGIYRLKKLVRKHRVLFGALAVIILSLSVAVVFMLIAYAEIQTKERQARDSLAVMRETEDTLRRLTGLGDRFGRHGDYVEDGWSEDFESYDPPQPSGPGSQKWQLPVHDPEASGGLGENATWQRAADNTNMFLDRSVPGEEGNCWLRMDGAEGSSDGAVIARWVDSRHRSYVGDFTLTLRFRLGEGEVSGFNCNLRSRASWAPKRTPEQRQLVSSRNLFTMRPIDEGDPRKRIGLYIPWSKAGELSTHLVGRIQCNRNYELKIRYQRLAGNRFRVSGWLDDKALPRSPDGGIETFESEEELRWLHLSTVRASVWLDDIELRRSLPHSPWFENPGNKRKRYYALTPRPMGFAEARDYAQTRGGELATYGSDEEKAWLRQTFGRHDYFVDVQRNSTGGKGSDEGPDGWFWLDETGGPVAPRFWLGGKLPDLPGAQHAALGGYREINPWASEGEGGLIPVAKGAELHALMEFEKKPDRGSYGRLGGDLDWARSLGGRSLGTETLALDPLQRSRGEILSLASVAADREVENPGGYVVCGSFRNEAVLGTKDGGEREDVEAERCRLQSAGDLDVFVARFDRQGSLLWARVFGGRGEDQGRGVAVDAKGRIYIVGAFSDKAALGFAEGEGSRSENWELQSAGGLDLFVLCLDSDGNCQWLDRLGDEGEDLATGVACSDQGRIFVSGWVSGGISAGGAGQVRRPAGTGRALQGPFGKKDILLACWSGGESEGQAKLLWQRRAGGKRDDLAQAVAAMTNGSVVITGGFQDCASFGKDASGREIAYRSDATRRDEQKFNLFIARYGADGALEWVRHPGGEGGRTMGYAVAAGKSGDCYVAGAVDKRIYLGGPQRSYAELHGDYIEDMQEVIAGSGAGPAGKRLRDIMACDSSGWVDMFLVRMDKRGGVAWFTNPKGEDHCNMPYGLAVASDGSVLMTGRVQGACNFAEHEPGQCLRSSYSQSQPDLFVARFRPLDGGLSWVRTARGPGANWGSGVAALTPERALVVGGFHGPLHFGEGEPRSKTLVGGAIFMAAFHTREQAPR